MRLDAVRTNQGRYIVAEATVSRRNLLALLQKSYAPQSHGMLSINGTLDGVASHFSLRVEADKVHYADREPGSTAVYTDEAMQIAIDMIQQVSDDLADDDAFVAHRLDHLANQAAYIATQIAGRKIGVR